MSGLAVVRSPGTTPAAWEYPSARGRLVTYATLAALVLCPAALAVALVLRALWAVRRPPAWFVLALAAGAAGWLGWWWHGHAVDWRGGLAGYWQIHAAALALAWHTAVAQRLGRALPAAPPDAARAYLTAVAPLAAPAGIVLAAAGDLVARWTARPTQNGASLGGDADDRAGGHDDRARAGAGGVVDVAGGGEPAARPWVVDGIVPDGYVSLLYGDGGLGKSALAVHLALCVVTGQGFAGHAVRPGRVLYVDGELDRDEFVRRAYAAARGMGLARPPKGLYYYRLPGPLTDPAVQRRVAERVARCGPWWPFWRSRRPVLVVFDSLTIAAGLGQSANDAAVAAIFGAMERWRCATVAIDHVTKPAAGSDPRTARPFSSTFKWNHCRSAVVLVPAAKAAQAKGATLEAFHRKCNFGPLFGAISLAVERETPGDPPRLGYRLVTVDGADAADDPPAVADECAPAPTLTAADRLWLALEGCGAAGATVEELAAAVGSAPKTVRNTLYALRKDARAVATDGGRWRAVVAAAAVAAP